MFEFSEKPFKFSYHPKVWNPNCYFNAFNSNIFLWCYTILVVLRYLSNFPNEWHQNGHKMPIGICNAVFSSNLINSNLSQESAGYYLKWKLLDASSENSFWTSICFILTSNICFKDGKENFTRSNKLCH